MMETHNSSPTAKVVLVGEMSVGKTCTVLRYVKGVYNNLTDYTVGACFFMKEIKVKEQLLKFHIWDTAGQERYRAMTSVYYRGAQGALIFYDVTNRWTFDGKIDEWVSAVKNGAPEKVNIILVGNKVDDETNRQVSTEEGRECAKRLGVPFFEVSAKEGTCIEELFNELGDLVIDNNIEEIKIEDEEATIGNVFLGKKLKRHKCFI